VYSGPGQPPRSQRPVHGVAEGRGERTCLRTAVGDILIAEDWKQIPPDLRQINVHVPIATERARCCPHL
jgi:hypothetical protein